MADEKKLFKVTIDNITIDVEPGTSILQAARSIGGDVVPPAMCYYTKLQGSGGKRRNLPFHICFIHSNHKGYGNNADNKNHLL